MSAQAVAAAGVKCIRCGLSLPPGSDRDAENHGVDMSTLYPEERAAYRAGHPTYREWYRAQIDNEEDAKKRSAA